MITCTAKNGKKYKCKVVVKNHIYDVKVISEATKKSKGSSIFTCKECGETHLMYDGEPHDGIRVPCAWDEGKVKEYDEKDFQFYHGMITLLTGQVKPEN